MTLTRAILPVAMILLGLAMVIRTVSGGGGPLALGLLLGVLFVAAGAGRLYVERRSP